MRTVIFIFGLFAFVSCSNIKKVKIKGTLLNSKGQTMYFEEVDVYRVKLIDSLRLKNKGRFSFSAQTKIPQFYQLRSDNEIISLLLEPGESAVISGDLSNLGETLLIKGSTGSQLINELSHKLRITKSKLDSLATNYNSSSDETARKDLSAKYEKVIEDHRRYSINFILNNYSSLASIRALYQEIQPQSYLFNKTRDIQFYKIVRDSLRKRYPRSNHVSVLNKYTSKLIQDYHTQKILSYVKQEDYALPEIALPDIRGDTINLLSLKGKYVLLSFWASWNVESVNANIKLKDVYDRYKHKGFEIYQVSFDKSIAHWKRAINFDELPWLCVNDSTYPDSRVVTRYNVNTIPCNYLIDKDMETIIAKNINSNALNRKLSELLN